MIGFYSYTVILTYLGLASAALGMMLTFNGFARYALFCLAFSGLCDMFDGKVARTKANRTEDEKRFGIQIDSLCDVVCFGAFPMILCYSMGMRGIAGICILVFYLTAGVIRLAFFNVMEERRQDETDEAAMPRASRSTSSASPVTPGKMKDAGSTQAIRRRKMRLLSPK